jgi:hypothetical protein
MMLSKLMSKKGVPPVAKAATAEGEWDQADINKGLAEESKEHPWLDPKSIRRLVMDHLKMHGSDYYGEEDKAHEKSESAEQEKEEHDEEHEMED